MTNSVKINGQSYLLDELSDTAKSMLRNFNVAEARLAQLRQDAAMVQLARDTYGDSLLKNLPAQPAGLAAATNAPKARPVKADKAPAKAKAVH
jgi:hypothetical protein